MSLVPVLEALQDSWREEFSDRAIARYADKLSQFPEGVVAQAVDDLIGTEKFRPSIGQILEQVAERALNLPTTEEAWEIAERGSLKQAPETVRAAAEHVGGRWAILHSDNIATVRAQFRKAYDNLRQQALNDYVRGGRPPQPALTGVSIFPELGPTMKELPATERVIPRPVQWRWIRRMGGVPMDPPTEEEKADAIAVLAQGPVDEHEPWYQTYVEAERILEEAGA